MSDLARFLYTHNPFYLISAACVLFGFRTIYRDTSLQDQAWMLAFCLAAYTLLLAVTAIVIVRLGRVWDDARTVALLSILMCLALSSSFDSTCHHAPAVARVVLISGLAFSAFIVGMLQTGLPIVLPAIYRIPLLAILALFFLFPMAMSIGFARADSTGLAWKVLLFPVICGLSILMLIPAARRGAKAVVNNGSPWPWPLYPWSIFFFLLIGMVGRSYLLTISFQLDTGMTSSFAAYYLIPILLSTIWVLSEGALAAKKTAALSWLGVCSLGLPLIASIPSDSYAAFLFHSEITRTIGSPLWLTILATSLFAVYCWWRGAESFKYVLTVQLVLLIGISPTTKALSDFELYNYWPLVGMIFFQIVQLLRKATTVRYLVALTLLVGGIAFLFPNLARDNFGALPIHLFLSGVLAGSLWFDDWFAQRLRAWLALVSIGLVAAAAAVGLIRSELFVLAIIYVAVVWAGSCLLSYATNLSVWRIATAISTLGMILVSGGQLLIKHNWQIEGEATVVLLAGAGFFFCGTIISASKAGMGKGPVRLLTRELQRAKSELYGERLEKTNRIEVKDGKNGPENAGVPEKTLAEPTTYLDETRTNREDFDT